ncbi:acetyltransferase [Variovorax ureilyticus]|uniref:acetyltransferase n=1 Tax=Variovorax ureilyticus TaxID=1836198 RepID=UPI003D668AFA
MRIVLLGGGGHASDVLGAIEALQAFSPMQPGVAYTVVGILADADIDMRRFAARGVTQIGSIDDMGRIDASHYVACVGYPKSRRSVVERAAQSGLQALTLVHPRAWVHPGVPIGPGSVVLAGSCISPGSEVGAHVYLGQGSIIGHDCVVGDYVSVMPGATVSGDTEIGPGALVGANATILEKRSVGPWARVGAGAVVTKDIPGDAVAVGIPARF